MHDFKLNVFGNMLGLNTFKRFAVSPRVGWNSRQGTGKGVRQGGTCAYNVHIIMSPKDM